MNAVKVKAYACLIGALLCLGLAGNFLPQAQAKILDLNSMISSRWEEWDALLTRWMGLNGTVVVLYDYSRKSSGHPSNKKSIT